MRFATKVTTHLLWDVTGSFTYVVIFVEKSYFWEIVAAMRFDGKYHGAREARSAPQLSISLSVLVNRL